MSDVPEQVPDLTAGDELVIFPAGQCAICLEAWGEQDKDRAGFSCPYSFWFLCDPVCYRRLTYITSVYRGSGHCDCGLRRAP